MNILIVGDSFAAPSNEKYTWYNRLSQKHTIKNIAEAGVGEYKILKQILMTTMSYILKTR